LLEIVLLCAGCHGMSGEGRPEAGYPRLAAQPEAYLVRQLEAFASGRRKSAVMEPLARSLTAEERRRLAQEFAHRTPAPTATAKSNSRRGETLAHVGDAALRVQACQNCHGPQGRGQAPYGPSLAGLPPQYLRAELIAWRNGSRVSDPSGQMPMVARALREEDLEAVVAYYAGLPVPAPLRPEPLPRYVRTQPPTRSDVGFEKGKGSEAQGSAPTTGGAQGPAGATSRK
jgi:cytochrome c553